MNSDDHEALPEYVHGMADGRIAALVFLGKAALGRQLYRDLALLDPAFNIIRYMHIRIFGPVRINWPRCHKITIDAL